MCTAQVEKIPEKNGPALASNAGNKNNWSISMTAKQLTSGERFEEKILKKNENKKTILYVIANNN